MTLQTALSAWEAQLTAAGASPRLNPPASAKDMAATEQKLSVTFPAELRGLYQLANGSEGGLLLGMPLHTLEQLEAEYANWEDLIYGSGGMLADSEEEDLYSSDPPGTVQLRYWVRGWLPLCKDGGGNHIACDLAPAEAGVVGQLITMGPDEDNHVRLARSLSELWEASARKLERGELKIDEAGSWSTPGGYVPFNAFREDGRGLL